MGSVASLISDDKKPAQKGKNPMLRRSTVFMDDMDYDQQYKVKARQVSASHWVRGH